jgi:hypothetical protein
MAGNAQESTSPWVSIADVMEALDMSEDTVRRHYMPFSEWKSGGGFDGKITATKVVVIPLGHQSKIPRWWLVEMRKRAREGK